jgi:hypothetical protein
MIASYSSIARASLKRPIYRPADDGPRARGSVGDGPADAAPPRRQRVRHDRALPGRVIDASSEAAGAKRFASPTIAAIARGGSRRPTAAAPTRGCACSCPRRSDRCVWLDRGHNLAGKTMYLEGGADGADVADVDRAQRAVGRRRHAGGADDVQTEEGARGRSSPRRSARALVAAPRSVRRGFVPIVTGRHRRRKRAAARLQHDVRRGRRRPHAVDAAEHRRVSRERHDVRVAHRGARARADRRDGVRRTMRTLRDRSCSRRISRRWCSWTTAPIPSAAGSISTRARRGACRRARVSRRPDHGCAKSARGSADAADSSIPICAGARSRQSERRALRRGERARRRRSAAARGDQFLAPVEPDAGELDQRGSGGRADDREHRGATLASFAHERRHVVACRTSGADEEVRAGSRGSSIPRSARGAALRSRRDQAQRRTRSRTTCAADLSAAAAGVDTGHRGRAHVRAAAAAPAMGRTPRPMGVRRQRRDRGLRSSTLKMSSSARRTSLRSSRSRAKSRRTTS